MDCNEARELLMGAEAAAGGKLADHLRGCEACSGFAARLGAVREALRGHHAGVEPDPAFAARVVSALPGPPEVLGWAAVRLLPATLALAVALTAWCLVATPSPGDLLGSSPTDDPLGWVVASSEEGS